LWSTDHVSIAVEDWDDLGDAPSRDKGKKGERAPVAHLAVVAPAPRPTPVAAAAPVPRPAPVAQPAAAAPAPRRAFKTPRRLAAARTSDPLPVTTWDTLEPVAVRKPAPEAKPERVLGLAQFDDDDYGEVTENLRVPAGIAAVNLLVWLVGVFGHVVECVGLAFFVSIGLLLAAYLTREAQRDRTALILLAGSIPLPLTIIGLFV
jgi:hypothetical protein